MKSRKKIIIKMTLDDGHSVWQFSWNLKKNINIKQIVKILADSFSINPPPGKLLDTSFKREEGYEL